MEVKNDDGLDRWFMTITDGTVQGPQKTPYLVGAQWNEANSTTAIESTAICRCHIKTIIGVISKP